VSCTGDGEPDEDEDDEDEDEEDEEDEDDDGAPEDDEPDAGDPGCDALVPPAAVVPPFVAAVPVSFCTSWVGSDGSPSLHAKARVLSRRAARACENLMKTGCAWPCGAGVARGL